MAYSVLKKAKDRFVVEAALSGQSHVLAVFGAQWSTLTLGEATDSGQEIKIAAESDDPLPSDVGQFTGKVLAVRCKEAKGDRIEVDFRVYEVQHGHIVAQKRSKDSLAEGELKELELPW